MRTSHYPRISLVMMSIVALIAALFATSGLWAQESTADSSAESVAARPLQDPTRPLGYRTLAKTTRESLKLNSILYARGRRIAVINGKEFSEQQQSGDLKILSIDEDSVEVLHNGRNRTLTLSRSIRH